VRAVFAVLPLCLLVPSARAENCLVIPFFNLSNNTNLDWIGESLAETAREDLSAEGLVTLDRDARLEAFRRLSVRPYSPLTIASVIKIGEAVDAERVVYGSYDLKTESNAPDNSRGSLEISAHIIDLKHMRKGTDLSEVGALENLAALQGHLAWQLLQVLAPNGAISEADFRTRHPAVRVDAIENYVRGLLAVNLDDQHRFFALAVRLDPHYSPPCFQLGRLLFQKKDYKTAAEWFQKVGVEDAHHHEAGFFLGLSRYYDGDFAGAQAAFESVAQVVPLSEVYNNLGAAESRGNLPGALANFRKALDGDTNDPAYRFNTGYALWKQGEFAAAADEFRAVLARVPDDAQANTMLGRCLSRHGPRPGDIEHLERIKTNYEESAYWQLKAVLQPHQD